MTQTMLQQKQDNVSDQPEPKSQRWKPKIIRKTPRSQSKAAHHTKNQDGFKENRTLQQTDANKQVGMELTM